MTSICDRVIAIINAAGGEVVGKTRMQKLVYLIQESHADIGFDFEYHHYGPYSSELSKELAMSTFFDDVKEEPRRRHSDGVPYSVFSTMSETSAPYKAFVDEVSGLAKCLREENSTVLELAATIHWLHHKEGFKGSALWRELEVRKGAKASSTNVEAAKRVLNTAKLSVA